MRYSLSLLGVGGTERATRSQHLRHLLDEARRIREAHAANNLSGEEAAEALAQLRKGDFQSGSERRVSRAR